MNRLITYTVADVVELCCIVGNEVAEDDVFIFQPFGFLYREKQWRAEQARSPALVFIA